MNRRHFLTQTTAALTGAAFSSLASALPDSPPDFQLEIAPLDLEIAPRKITHTIAYNGRVPGPLIRWPEGKPITIDVSNRTSNPEIVHSHGLWIPSEMDGATEEGSALIAPGTSFRYAFTPRPAGFRWYHTHTSSGTDLKRATYTGQFGCFYIEPKQEPGAYDQELFLTLHDWEAYKSASGDSSMEPAYEYSTIDGRMLGAGDPLKVREGQRILLRILNASASLIHWLALSGHQLTVIAMDGNPVPAPTAVPAIRLGPAERLDVLVTMNRPGVWILGETREPLRKAGMGIVVEYANQSGKPSWIDPPDTVWDYRLFAKPQAPSAQPDEIIPLRFESKFHGRGAFDTWTINGKSFPDTDPILLKQGQRYRLQLINHSPDDHPLHLHRHTFEVTSLNGSTQSAANSKPQSESTDRTPLSGNANATPLSGLLKDVLVVPANTTAEVDFTANNPGPTLFHCHNQVHMDLGFMTLLRYTL